MFNDVEWCLMMFNDVAIATPLSYVMKKNVLW